jgi:hypothetical protein
MTVRRWWTAGVLLVLLAAGCDSGKPSSASPPAKTGGEQRATPANRAGPENPPPP